MSDSWLLRNARLRAGGPPTDVTIGDGVVADIGPAVQRSTVRAVDLDGRTLLPGLWDCHVHSTQWALRQRSLDVSGARSAAEVARLVADRARTEDPDTAVLFAYGAREADWPDLPSLDLLSAAAPDRAVVVQAHDLHLAWLNQAALALVDLRGHPTGLLREQECFRTIARVPGPTPAQIDRWVLECMQAAARRGVTGILDFEMSDNAADWSRRGTSPVRVRASIPRTLLPAAVESGVRSGDPVEGTATATVGPVKIFADGSLTSQNAYCCDPYPGTPTTYGSNETDADELAALLLIAAHAGLEVAIHAIGDRATQAALDAFEQTGCAGRIEHAQLVRPSDLPRFARLGLVVGAQPAHLHDDRDLADRVWAGRTGRSFAYRDLLDHDATLELGSDAPVSPLDPWLGIAAAVGRSLDDRPAWHGEQALTLPEALSASTRGRAEVRVGDVADLMIVGDLDETRLATTPVHGTLLGGAWTHREL